MAARATSENVPAVVETESNDSVGESLPKTSDAEVEAPKDKAPKGNSHAQFGPGSKVKWDNEAADPNKRHHIGIDPTGQHNAKRVFGDSKKSDDK